jgi:hypothetical protein
VIELFFQSYLIAFLFWFGIAMGSLAILLVHQLSGGVWGRAVQPYLTPAVRLIPVMALFFIPIILGLKSLYPWAADPHVVHGAKAVWLSLPFFLGRTIFYWVGWILLSFWIDKKKIGGPGILFYGLTMTFAAFDWVMSLDPHWVSSVFGVWVVIAQALSALAFCAVSIVFLAPQKQELKGTQQLHDLGNLMLAMTLFWAYITFTQFLIIWTGNLKEEVTWYLHRGHGGWQYMSIILVLFHFFVPFGLLLSRDLKKNPKLLAIPALFILSMRFMDLTWTVYPIFHDTWITGHWMNLLVFVAVSIGWIALYKRELVKTS